MIKHAVIFKLKHPPGAEETKAFWRAAERLVNIPGVSHFECLKQVSLKNRFDYGLTMEFTDQASYDHYSSHPDHVQFVASFWIANVEDFLEIDLVPFAG